MLKPSVSADPNTAKHEQKNLPEKMETKNAI